MSGRWADTSDEEEAVEEVPQEKVIPPQHVITQVSTEQVSCSSS